jgi:hypothetical protein
MNKSRNLRRVLPWPRAAAAIAALAGALALPTSALAQMTDSNFVFRIGGFFPKVDTHARADGNNGLLGTNIDFETDLGLDDSKTLPIVDMDWRLGYNHRLTLGYLDLSRDATNTLHASITWQGQVFPIATQVHSEFDSKILQFSYLYSFFHTPETEIAAGLGIHNANLKAQLNAVGTNTGLTATREASGNAPLPVLTFRAAQKFGPQIGAEFRYQWFGIKYGDYDGSLNVFNAAVSYYPWRNWGLEVGYNYSKYDLKVSRDSWHGEANYKFDGPVVAIVASF